MSSLIVILCSILLSLAVVELRNIAYEDYDPDESDPDLAPAQILSEEYDTEFWLNKARKYVKHKYKEKYNINKAKNIIFFLGDGMSLQTTTATRVLMGGEELSLSFEQFPHTGVVKTYCYDKQVADSACTATAYLSGVKTRYKTINQNAKSKYNDCYADLQTANHVYSIAKWAMDAGKSVGIVTTTRVTHASPAGVYANTANRNWEDDSDRKLDCPQDLRTDIANQLVHGNIGKKLSVVFGGGRQKFLDKKFIDDEQICGSRSDGRNLIEEWKNVTKGEYVWNLDGLMNLNAADVNHVLGLFAYDNMMYHLETVHNNIENKMPRLYQMTDRAIDILKKNEEGFFLFVEGGRIDMGHHDKQARIALDETIELSKAVAIVRNKLPEGDTLIVVSSDHSHTMSYAGYGNRGSDIFGVGRKDENDIPYLKLSYANGAPFSTFLATNGSRADPTQIANITDYKFSFPSTVPLDLETHSGGDVAIFAIGPYSHLFIGAYEQNVIPHIMAYAACIGDGIKACD